MRAMLVAIACGLACGLVFASYYYPTGVVIIGIICLTIGYLMAKGVYDE